VCPNAARSSIAALIVILTLTNAACASEQCPGLSHIPGPLSSALSPDVYEQRQHALARRATYEALLAAGAPEKLACAAALDPQILQQIAPTYFRPPTR
jgi:hypothetical protein